MRVTITDEQGTEFFDARGPVDEVVEGLCDELHNLLGQLAERSTPNRTHPASEAVLKMRIRY